ncbi:MAG TPA: 7-carboxy-7-deazaguanine synthase QueE [Phycisphaerales bacterium]|nr:7-carboxy-7-deazaguanine synthase QueE [Phycisphaerales bacterium]
MNVTEIFYSLQGEGRLAGVPSVFVRLAGCPLRCRWCDTRYAWSAEQGDPMPIDGIVRAVRQYPCRHVVITGGEPMMAPDLSELTAALRDADLHITIETSGIAHNRRIACDLMSISPKLANSTPEDPHLARIHEPARFNLAVLRVLLDTYDYQLKFVVDAPADLDEIEQTLRDLAPVNREKVLLMPQAATRDELIRQSPRVADLCKQHGLAFCPRMHILLWDNRPGV